MKKTIIDILIWVFGILALAGWALGLMAGDPVVSDSVVVKWYKDRLSVVLFGFLSAGICFNLFVYQYEDAARDLFRPLEVQRFTGAIFTLGVFAAWVMHLMGLYP